MRKISSKTVSNEFLKLWDYHRSTLVVPENPKMKIKILKIENSG